MLAGPVGAQEQQPFSTPYDTPLSVTAGERVMVEGQYELHDVAKVSADIKSTMPGSMKIPFSFSIKAGELKPEFETENFEYFCADPAASSASFPGLGVVVDEGDCVGVRRGKKSVALEWFVDNSHHNGARNHAVWVWSRRVKPDEEKLISFEKRQVIGDVSLNTVVEFNGYYSGLLNFTVIERGQRREMKFDYGGSGQKLIGMVGKKMTVLSADSVELKYMWVK
jgi:hypothetical protein